jgi:short-subunit dehydrogenase
MAEYALITGASSGIGECFARALAARKRNLVLVARSQAKLEALAGELRAACQVQAEPVALDLSVPGAAAQLAQLVTERKLGIDLLINNAGFGTPGEFWRVSLEREAEMVRLNVQALMELTHLLLPPMIERRHGAVINVSSTASFQPLPYSTLYAATKAFVTSFSLALSEEVRPYGLRVVTLCPGVTATNFFVAGGYGTRRAPGGFQAPEEVVSAALKALDHKGGLVVPRLLNKFGVFIQRFVPRSAVLRVTARMFRRR